MNNSKGWLERLRLAGFVAAWVLFVLTIDTGGWMPLPLLLWLFVLGPAAVLWFIPVGVVTVVAEKKQAAKEKDDAEQAQDGPFFLVDGREYPVESIPCQRAFYFLRPGHYTAYLCDQSGVVDKKKLNLVDSRRDEILLSCDKEH